MSRHRKPKVVEIAPGRVRVFSGAKVLGEAEFYEEPAGIPIDPFWGGFVARKGIPVPLMGFHATQQGAVSEILGMYQKQTGARP